MRTKPDMAQAIHATVQVAYSFRDGYHIFTSDEIYGLYVASRDARQAYESVAPAIRELARLNHQIDIEVEASLSFERFVDAAKTSRAASDAPHPAILSSSQFLIRKAA